MTWDDAIKEIEAMHAAKQQDYGVDGDEYRNLRAGENYGVPAWVHACVMADHKSARIQSFVTKGRLENEGVRDSLLDRCVYSIAALVLYDESVEGEARGQSSFEAERQAGRTPSESSNPTSPSTYCPDCRSMTRSYRDKLWAESFGAGPGRWLDCMNEWHDA